MKILQMKTTKIVLAFATSLALVYALQTSCSSADDFPPAEETTVTTTTNTESPASSCFKCHSESNEIGQKIKWAEAGWDQSMHKNGALVPILPAGADDPIGWEWEGSDAFYSNGGGCQTCHTNEGFGKKVAGGYADSAAESADFIANPSPIGCFTCHKPHERGDLSLTVKAGTQVTIPSGGVYAKPKGSTCASCHVARLSGYSSAKERAIETAKAGISRFGLKYWYSHHGPQTDMLVGTGAAEYQGQSYANSAHSSTDGANCITCHTTYSDTSRASLSPNVGGHSFRMVGVVHGAEKANTAGCKSCHSSVATTTVSPASGVFRRGDIYFKKDGTDTTPTDIDAALTLLADPGNNCSGLLANAYDFIHDGNATNASATISWETLGEWNRCTFSGFNTYSLPANAAADENTGETRFLMGYWNYRFVREDQSFGIHNRTYALQVLYDTCENLKALTGGAQNCGTRP